MMMRMMMAMIKSTLLVTECKRGKRERESKKQTISAEEMLK